jgi:hypothetical protein
MPKAKSNSKPARGGPASGIPARGGPPSGAGWGGPAKGANNFPKDSKRGTQMRNSIPANMAISARQILEERQFLRADRVKKLETIMMSIAEDEMIEANARLSAAARLHAIYEGQPVARTITANEDDVGQLTDAELALEIARRTRGFGQTIEGTSEEVGSE